MSKAIKHRKKPHTAVARLMGLDSLPSSQHVARQMTLDGHSYCKHRRGMQDDYLGNSVSYDDCTFSHGNGDYIDIYEVQQQPQSTIEDTLCRKRMSLVQQKFTEAKRIARDENPLQSKEFQDAIKFLSSNRDSFLKFLEEPNSLFSKHLSKSQSSPFPSETKRITILKPSIAIMRRDSEDSGSKRIDDNNRSAGNSRRHWSSDFSQSKPQRLSQPTRIVILKPSSWKHDEIKTKKYSEISLPKVLRQQQSFGALESRTFDKETSCHTQDQSFFSPVLSNGYVGDESSCNRSESEFMEEESGSLSDSEMATPTSTHSCDYANRLGSPYLFTSFSRLSHSPESCVIREAKKRLADRLTQVATNVNNQEYRLEKANSGTLAEMLAFPEVTKGEKHDISSRRLINEKQDMKIPSSFLSTGRANEGSSFMRSPKDLSRSNSAPVSLSAYKATSVEVTSSLSTELVTKEDRKLNTVKLGFKEKVSSFFFSKSKKRNSDNSTSVIANSRQQPSTAEACGDEGSTFPSEIHLKEVDQVNNSSKNDATLFTTSVYDDGSNQDASHLRKIRPLVNFAEKQKRPSPISVVSTPFIDDARNSLFQLSESTMLPHPQALGRSWPIESVARSLSTDCSYSETPSKPLKISSIFCKADEEHEQFLFIKSLVSSARLDTRSGTILSRWHSLESPLNPILFDEYLNTKDTEVTTSILTHSRKHLLFDCINAALLDLSQRMTKAAYPWDKACGRARGNNVIGVSLTDEVWRSISNWDSCSKYMMPGKSNCINLFVDKLVKKEAIEWQSAEFVWLEMYEFSKDISGKVLEELVEEALSQLIK